MQFRRSTAQSQASKVPTEAVRLTRWWRGYQRGQVARFPLEITGQLKAKGWAIPYKPTSEEARDDSLRAQIQEEGLAQDRMMRDGAIASQAASAPLSSRAAPRR